MPTPPDTSRKTHADHVYDLLFAQLMEGARAPGEQVNIPALAAELEVSRTPVREALARLESTGLVRREALKGYTVAPLLSEADLVKLMEARLVLEPALSREAARRVTPEFLAELEATIDHLSESNQTRHPTFREFWSSDERFHALIARQSGNPFLETSFAALGGQVQRFRLFAHVDDWNAAPAAAEHRAIFAALDGRDPDRAALAMKTHLRNATERALSDRHAIALTARR